jgi:hypothetical protein
MPSPSRSGGASNVSAIAGILRNQADASVMKEIVLNDQRKPGLHGILQAV